MRRRVLGGKTTFSTAMIASNGQGDRAAKVRRQMAEFDFETVDALNTLLEDERASVEMEVALASGASEYVERETLTAMGADDIGFCIALHERLDEAGAPVTRRINGVVFQALGAERYDDRLLVLARHQLIVTERYRDLPARDLDDETRDLLRDITTTHERHIAWLERRAHAFAATRQLDFRSGNVDGSDVAGSGADTNQTAHATAPDRLEDIAPDDDPADDDPEGNAFGQDSASHDGQGHDREDAPRRRASGRHEPPAPYMPGTPTRSSADGRGGDPRYRAPQWGTPADDTPVSYAAYPADIAADDADAPPAPTPTPPPVRRRYGAYRPGAPNDTSAQATAAYPPYTYAGSADPNAAPDPSAPYTATRDDTRDGDDQP